MDNVTTNIQPEGNPHSFKDQLHDFRKQIDACIGRAAYLKGLSEKSVREMSLAYTKLQEAKMWVGKCLEMIGSELPKEFQDKA